MGLKDLDDLLRDEGDSTGSKRSDSRPVIVVIDDDPSIRGALGALLQDRYEVRVRGSAKEGVAAVDESVCAVVLDIKMKGLDGFWACDQIRRAHPTIPVIFYSAYQDLKNPYDIINQHRPFGYITKDSNIARLLDTLETAVRLHKMTLDNKRLLEALKKEREQKP